MNTQSKKAVRNARIPARLTDLYGECMSLFTADEAKSLSMAARINHRPGIIDKHWFGVAHALEWTIYGAATSEVQRSAASSTTIVTAYNGIANAIEHLLTACGYTPGIDAEKERLGKLSGSFPVLTELVLDMSSTSALRRQFGLNPSLHIGDFGAALLVLKGAALEASRTRLPDTSGSKPEIGLDDLFTGLAGIFYTVFGALRTVGRGSEDNEAVLWTRAVLNHAEAGFPHRTFRNLDEIDAKPLESSGVVELLSKANRLTAAGLGERLRDGYLSWKTQPNDRKWPINWWCPNGTPTSTGPFVPEWLSGADIRAL